MYNNVAIVSGSSGFIGKKLTENLLSSKYFVFGIDISESKITHKNYCHIKTNLNNIEYIKKCIDKKVDYFFHLAWIGVSDNNRNNFDIQMENIKNSYQLLEFCSKINVSKFIYAGSIMEYECRDSVFDYKKIVFNNNSIYGFSKLYSHMITLYYSNVFQIKYNCAMFSNVYGLRRKDVGLISYILNSILSKKIVELSSCTQEYDFIYIDDAVEALRFIAERGENLKEYYIGSKDRKKLKDYITEIIEVLGNENLLYFNEDKKGVHLDYSQFNKAELYSLGFVNKTSFKDGILQTYNSMVSEDD